MRLTMPRIALILSMLLATLLAVGLVTAANFVIGIASFVTQIWSQPTTSEQLVYTIEGEALLSVYLPGNPMAIYRTLDGKPVNDPQGVRISNASGSTELPPPGKNQKTLPGWQFRILGILQTTPTMNFWYLIQDGSEDPRAYLVGYQPQTKQVIGYIGRRGLRTTLPPVEDRMSVSGSFFVGALAPTSIGNYGGEPRSYDQNWQVLFLVSDGKLLKIDLARQSVETLDMPDKVESVGQFDQLTAVDDDRYATYETRLVVRLPKELRVLTTEGKPLNTIPLPEAARDQTVSVRGTTSNSILLQTQSADDHYAPLELYWLNPEGKVLRHQQASTRERPASDSAAGKWIPIAIVPMPLPLLAVPVISATISDLLGNGPDWFQSITDLVSQFWLPYGALVVASLVLAVYAYRRQKRFDPHTARAWAVFVFLLGPPGLIGYWLHRTWPARVPCARCGGSVPRNRAACLDCLEEFPPPALRGIEVLA